MGVDLDEHRVEVGENGCVGFWQGADPDLDLWCCVAWFACHITRCLGHDAGASRLGGLRSTVMV